MTPAFSQARFFSVDLHLTSRVGSTSAVLALAWTALSTAEQGKGVVSDIAEDGGGAKAPSARVGFTIGGGDAEPRCLHCFGLVSGAWY